MKTVNLNILIILVLMIFTGCTSELDIHPKNAISQDALNTSTLTQVRTGMYSKMEDVTYNSYFDFDMRGENLQAGPGFSLTDPLSMATSDPVVLGIWRNLYKGISNANFLISSVDNFGSNSATYQSYKGEALFFRALLYYNLVSRWGGVPIVLTNTFDVIQRSNEADVWNQIKSDLIASRNLVSPFSNKFYVSDQAVKALMARVYLATGDYTNAALYADSVIVSNKFALSTDANSYSTIFIPATSSKEVILGLANNTSNNLHLMYSPCNDTKATYTYSPALLQYTNLYSNSVSPIIKSGDVRKAAVFTSDKSRCIKYSNGKAGQQLISVSTPNYDPIVLFRLSEMYLIKAEALGAVNGASTLNAFLSKRYTTAPSVIGISALNSTDYQNLILDECRREFYLEGHWWYDVKRTNRTDLFTSLAGRNYLLFYPIPQAEKDITGYTQNDGY